MPRPETRQCRKCGKNRQLKFYKHLGGRVCVRCQKRTAQANTRDRYLRETYGITLEEYNQILEAQGNCCYICRRSPAYNYDVDHDHAIEKALLAEGVAPLVARRRSVRGLLCKTCNRRLLTAARDNKDTLANAILYLTVWPSDMVLRAELPVK